MKPRLLVTGAAGNVGTMLWPRLRDRFDLRLLDLRPVTDAPVGVEVSVGDITDRHFMSDAMQGMSAVLHLAGIPDPAASWADLVPANLIGTEVALTTAAEAGVRSFVFASSSHASGQYDVERVSNVDPTWAPRPCCLYGVSKVAGEALGRFTADHSDVRVVNLRLGMAVPRPIGALGLAVWLSPDDLAAAFTAATLSNVRFGTYYAASANTRGRWNLETGAREIGFVPVDDAERFAAGIDMSAPGPRCYDGAVDIEGR